MVEMGAALLDFDRDHLWHQYSSMTRPGRPYLVESASGTRLRLRVDGEPREVVDAMASWWCAIHGYAVPELDAAARAQLGRMSHVMFGGLTHTAAVDLGRRLVNLAPPALAKVFLADSWPTAACPSSGPFRKAPPPCRRPTSGPGRPAGSSSTSRRRLPEPTRVTRMRRTGSAIRCSSDLVRDGWP